ncbi:MAG: oxaloacetate decarboxylase [Woeseiaceae bacterium]
MTLKQRLQKNQVLIAPGIADTITAVIAEALGFEAVFLSGSAMAYTHLGRPDIGLLTLSEVASITARVAERVDVPIFVDADSGSGNAFNVFRAVRQLEVAGASCIQIEDQVHDKHPKIVTQRPVISIADMQAKLCAALDSRRDENLLISARSDAVFTEGVESAIERAVAYADTGVDLVFVEGLSKREDRLTLRNAVPEQCALLFNVALPNGADAPDVATLQTEGYSVALFPASIINATTQAAHEALENLRQSAGLPETSGRNQPANVAEAIGAKPFIERYQHWSKNHDE